MTQKPSNSPEFNTLIEQIKCLGFDGVLYSFYPIYMHNKKVQPILHHCEKFMPFVEHYLKNDYGNCDFIVRLALEREREFIDWWQEINTGNVNEDERQVTEDAKFNFNIHHGLTVIIPFGKFAVAAISVISMNENIDYFHKIKASSLAELQTYANNYHADIIKSSKELQFFIMPLLEKLTDKKKQVLLHLMDGKPMKTVDGKKIKQRYAEKLLLQLRQEFGNVSTNELMYILGTVNMQKYLLT